MKRFQSFLSIFSVCLLAGQSRAQDTTTPETLPSSSHGPFSSFLNPYKARTYPAINLGNSGRLDSLVRAGIIYLSLSDTIALSLENNIDIEVQRYGPRLAEVDLQRAKAGNYLRGVTTSVNTGSSSATGGSTGATNSGSSQASSTIGQTTSTTGPILASLDPILGGTIGWGHRTSPQSNTITTGTTSLVTSGTTANINVSQGFLTGTTGQLSFNNQTAAQNSPFFAFNPSTQSSAELYVSQHLSQGFGMAVNNRNIRIARNNIKVSDLVFRQQVIATVSNVIGLYWDLVSFNEDVAVKKQALALSQKLYNDNKRQVEIGTLAPIEIVRAEAEVASREQDLTVSETNVLQQETIIKNALSRIGTASPSVAEARIVPTDRIRIPDQEAIEPIQDMVARALNSRPELEQSRVQVDNSRISLSGVKNALRPTIDAYVDLKNNALAGSVNNLLGTPTTGTGTGFSTGAPDPYFIGGYGTVLGQIFGRNFPDYSVGVQLNIPLRNRGAQADFATASLTLRQSELQLQKQVNNIRVDVQNGVIALQQARARYQASQKNRILQEQTLDAEQKKYALGASTVFLVIQAQRDLAQAQSNEVSALSAYSHARVQIDQALGDVLEKNNVQMDEAYSGRVSKVPSPLPVLDKDGKPIR